MLTPKLNLRVSQRQVLTPGLVQMVSVLALNKLELKEMINAEVVENPVLEEIEDNSETYEEQAGREGDRELTAEQQKTEKEREEKDPFDEIDMGEYFQDYLDPGFRVAGPSFEDVDAPSFENFLSKPSTLSDHLLWQLGSMSLRPELRMATEVIVGNLEDNGYLLVSDEELAAHDDRGVATPQLFAEARAVVQSLDPIGVGAADLRECLLLQVRACLKEVEVAMIRARAQSVRRDGEEGVPDAFPALEARRSQLKLACRIVTDHLQLLQKRDLRELMRLLGSQAEPVNNAIECIRQLDPRPGQRYNLSETRLIEPDVAFVKRGDDWVVVMNEEDLPALRLNAGYRKMLRQKDTEREVKEYVKERYRSAIQLLRNIEQRKNTIVRTCECIVRRQGDFLERGVDAMRPMMIKEVAEEIGVHPSTVSRAVANKYVHTPQGVYELRFFFAEGVNGPEGGDLPLPLLKKKVRKLIDDEDPRKPLTDDALAAELQRQGIQVTRRTVAKYREDMNIASTHQRRQRQ
ncbi:RNA polymerase factor sigma-54 [Terriglobus roseus]|uniref:RNA polymerase, sigma 54 subunit, RpoN/SigL n=1 Tax=Terriglobus roseus TaxID=392734 RepID=A0A1H4JKF7_9BACT|nr:RNA polymerase sigma-54 factor [Terriglobus roseus]SEB46346.1 RNA polymerase, sigma 54 subunit, RpoN/SigL [Terriglobus roseus]